MSAHLARSLGTDALGQLAVTLLLSSKAPNTYRSYGQKVQKFLRFCAQQKLDPCGCTQHDIVRYVAWLALEGRVAAESMQPYFSAINRLYEDLGHTPVAVGPLVRQAVLGLAGMQAPSVPVLSERAPLPAGVAYDILVRAAACLAGEANSQPPLLGLVRACLSTVVAFIFFARPAANARLLDANLQVIPGPPVSIQLLPVSLKGRDRVKPHKIHPLVVPAAAFSSPAGALPGIDIAALLQRYKQLRDLAFGGVGPRYMWALPGDSPAAWTSATQTSWLQSAVQLACHTPPAGFKFTGHSMRKGAATAASAVGVPLPTIKHFGGWSPRSAVVERDYIDPSVRPTPAAAFFFGWLTQVVL